MEVKTTFDESKEYTLEELNNLLNDNHKQAAAIRKMINEIKLKEMNFVGKVIAYKPYGYMFVNDVYYSTIYDEYEFHGLILTAYIDNEYPEDSLFKYDFDEWHFTKDTMIRILNNNEFEIVDNDKFVKNMNLLVEDLKKNIEIVSKKILKQAK